MYVATRTYQEIIFVWVKRALPEKLLQKNSLSTSVEKVSGCGFPRPVWAHGANGNTPALHAGIEGSIPSGSRAHISNKTSTMVVPV